MSGRAHGGGRGAKKRRTRRSTRTTSAGWSSYADMMTLLMVLFIVLFAISQVDQTKFAALKPRPGAPASASQTVGRSSGKVAADGARRGATRRSTSTGHRHATAPHGELDTGPAGRRGGHGRSAAPRRRRRTRRRPSRRSANFEQIETRDRGGAAASTAWPDAVQFTIDERGLVVTVVTNESSSTATRPSCWPPGAPILARSRRRCASCPTSIEVDGHTNQLPVTTGSYPSGWELSTARASTVVRYLHQHAGIAGEPAVGGRLRRHQAAVPGRATRARSRSTGGSTSSCCPTSGRHRAALLPSAAADADSTMERTIPRRCDEKDQAEAEPAEEGQEEARSMIVHRSWCCWAAVRRRLLHAEAAAGAAEAGARAGRGRDAGRDDVNLADGHYLKLKLALQATDRRPEAPDGSKALDIAIDLFSNQDSMAELVVQRQAAGGQGGAHGEDREGLRQTARDHGRYFTEFVIQ